MSEPKKHHYVPRFILRHFADSNGRLRVHRVDIDRSYMSNANDLAHTNRGHTLYWPDREPDHVTLEKGMSDIEGAAATVVSTLLQNGQRVPDERQREVLGFLIALQWHRSRFLIDTLQRSVLEPGATVDELARSLGIRQIIYNLLAPWYARANDAFDPKETACSIVDRLGYGPWDWRLYRPTSAKLIVGDNLVCMDGVADGEAVEVPESWTRHGMGVGFGNCARITMPIAPTLGVIITRRNQVHRAVTAATFNRATVFNAREFVAHRPDGLPDTRLTFELKDDIRTQRFILPIFLGGVRAAAEKEARDIAEKRIGPIDQPFS
jgi:hypothetical protein